MTFARTRSFLKISTIFIPYANTLLLSLSLVLLIIAMFLAVRVHGKEIVIILFWPVQCVTMVLACALDADVQTVDWGSYARREAARFAALHKKEEAPPILAKWEIYRATKEATTRTGKQALQNYEDALAELCQKVRLGVMQREFEYHCRIAFITMFFKHDLDQYRDYLINVKKLPIDDKHYENLALLYPRRMGKTTIECIITAVIAVSQVDGNVLSFHLSSRQAKMWLDRAKEFLDMFRGSARFGWRVTSQDVREHIHIFANAAGTVNYIIALPGVFQGSANIGKRSQTTPPHPFSALPLSFLRTFFVWLFVYYVLLLCAVLVTRTSWHVMAMTV